MDFEEVIQQCTENLGPAPRRLPWFFNRGLWNPKRPEWLYAKPRDGLHKLFDTFPSLFRNGIVTWGHTIQVNSLMFEPGTNDSPGEMLYTLDDISGIDLYEMHQLARNLFSLKNTTPEDQNLSTIADYLTDELIRVFGLSVPSHLSNSYHFQISTVLFFREHLPPPKRFLQQELMPILVNPEPPFIATVLPSKFWPESFVEWWKEE